MKILKTICLFLLIPSLSGQVWAGSNRELVIMSHDSFNVSEGIVAKFETANNVKLRFLKAGDAGAALNQAILTKNNPMADVFFGVDNTFMSRGLDAGIFEPYASPMLGNIDDALKLDPEFRLIPVDFGDVCLNYDKKWFSSHDIPPPTDMADLIKPVYKGLTVVENPATSSPGLAFLLATIGRFGDPGYLDFWKELKANDVLVTNGWEDAYWGQFSAASEGKRPIVVSYASSPPAEVHFAKTPISEPPTAAVVENKSAFRQIEFIGILKGTKKRPLAEKLIDFMLDRPFQEDIPLQMFVFPANRTAVLPEVFKKHAKISVAPVSVDPERISANRDKWIQSWTELVLR
ncbi:MAG: thiamine ABC transporter substrate-binding protein [Desulfobacteraceae bacterium]|nr:thiamine ABC transporter substrate-binding protein [Desulfobacteraceae bacterium]